MSTYHYRLDTFEGPLDLLLHLIERHKINIYDIPIAKITEQYMEYIANWNQFDIRYSSEFLVMAATLLQIKSRLLLPKQQEEEEQVVDPRDELVQKLLEFQHIKQLAMTIEELQEKHSGSYSRNSSCSQIGIKASFDLREVPWLSIFYETLYRLPIEKQKVPQVLIEKETISLESSRELLLDRIVIKPVLLRDWMEEARTREILVNRFLAVLECLKLQLISLEKEGCDWCIVIGEQFETVNGGAYGV